MQENTICPGCGRYCNLERPHCGRGKEYRRTGKMCRSIRGNDGIRKCTQPMIQQQVSMTG